MKKLLIGYLALNFVFSIVCAYYLLKHQENHRLTAVILGRQVLEIDRERDVQHTFNREIARRVKQ